jgi:MFS family permease
MVSAHIHYVYGIFYTMDRQGVGALTAPIVATQFAQLYRWHFYYLTSLAVAILNTVLLVCIFGFKTQDGKFNVPFFSENVQSHDAPRGSECLAQIGQDVGEKETVGGSKYREMFKLKALHLLAFFILVYVGVEVTIGGKPQTTFALVLQQLDPCCRVDCDLRHPSSPRRAIVWLHIIWIFRR